MWIILEGADDAPDQVAERILDRFPSAVGIARPAGVPGDDPLDVLLSPYATYTAGSGKHLVSRRLHWPDDGDVFDESGLYEPLSQVGWRYVELFVEARGGITFLCESTDEASRWLATDSLTYGGAIDPDNVTFLGLDAMVNEAQKKELTYAPLTNYRHYLGSATPELLIICKPERAFRFELLASIDGDELWQKIGIASTVLDPAGLDHLIDLLGDPELVGVGDLPGRLENAIAKHGGDFVLEPDLGDVPRVVMMH